MRIVGLGNDGDGGGVNLLGRLFGSRDIALGVGLLRAAEDASAENRALLEMLLVSQMLDVALTAWLWRTERTSRTATLIVALTAPPTGALALATLVRLPRDPVVTPGP